MVVLSAYPTVLSAQSAMSASCILTTPVEEPVLLEALRRALEPAAATDADYALA